MRQGTLRMALGGANPDAEGATPRAPAPPFTRPRSTAPRSTGAKSTAGSHNGSHKVLALWVIHAEAVAPADLFFLLIFLK